MALHDRYGFIVTIVVAAGAALAIAGLFRPSLLPAVRSYLLLSVVAVAVQCAIGLVLVFTGHEPAQLIHWFYGAATLLAIPVGVFVGGSRGRYEPIWVVGGAVAALLFAFRAITTG